MRVLILVMITLLVALLFSTSAHADYLGMRQPSSFISLPLQLPTDSAGNNRPVVPDSCHVATWKDSTGGQVLYSATTTTLANFGTTCKVQRDTINGVVYWVFSDSVATLNADTTSRLLSGIVTLWWKGAPFQTRFTLDVGTWAQPLDVWNVPENTAFDAGSMAALLHTVPYKIDSVMWVNGQRPGAKSILRKNTNADTLDCYINGVLIWRQIYAHIGGYPGKAPDSTWTVGP